MTYKKDFGVLCKAHGCRANLAEYDIYYSGRFCTNCLRLEYIVTREHNLLKGDYYKPVLKDSMLQVTKVTSKEIISVAVYEGKAGGEEHTAGVYSKRLIYLFKRNQ